MLFIAFSAAVLAASRRVKTEPKMLTVYDGPSAILDAAARKQQPDTLVAILKRYAPVAMPPTAKPADAAHLCKVRGAMHWECFLLLPDHSYGYAQYEILVDGDGSAHLQVTYRPIGNWRE